MGLKLTDNEFEIKYNQYSQMIFNIAYTYFKNYDDSYDIMQDVFVKYLNSNKFNDENHEKAWLIRVTINHCKNVIKKKRRIINIDYEQYNNLKDEKNNTTELTTDIFDNVSKLPDKYKSVIILFYYNELSIKEIKDSLKISESAVKMRLVRAREMLLKMEEKND